MSEWIQRNLKLEITCPIVGQMAKAAENLARRFARFDATESVLVLAGDTGTGKTHVARAMSKWASFASGHGAVDSMFQSWPEACNSITEGYRGIVRDCIETDFLALDDVGAETDKFKTGALVDNLCQILSRRERKHTIITTNISPEKWGAKLDARVADRFLRNSVVVDLTGVPSYSVRRWIGDAA